MFSNLIFSPDIAVITGPLSSAVLNPRFFGWAVFVFWLKLKLPAQAVKRGTRIQTPMLVWLFLWGHSLQLMHSQASYRTTKCQNCQNFQTSLWKEWELIERFDYWNFCDPQSARSTRPHFQQAHLMSQSIYLSSFQSNKRPEEAIILIILNWSSKNNLGYTFLKRHCN